MLLRFLLLVIPLCAQTPEFWPGAAYDPAIPTLRKILGHDPGERISSPAQIVRYLEALAAAAPSRIKLYDYGKTWEGRRLLYAAIGSEANIRRLDEIRAGMSRLADPRKTRAAEARKLQATLPATLWLAYGVHGNEISSPDAALLTAYHLLAARNDKMIADILAGVVVFINPLQNPDGRERFVHNFEIAEGLEPDASPLAAEHNEPWPGGRTNHYHFDLNRDWLAASQPETRGHMKAVVEWHPLLFVDLHEMGSDATYYFAPEADPFNPHLGKELMESLQWVGRNNAKWFDHYGFSFFTREVYDNFYPGYGASWPCYYGGVAMTYEQASARGLRMRRSDDTEFSFRDTVRQHFVASLSTAETAARYRDRLLEKFYRYRQTAIEEGAAESIKEYILPRRGNVSAVDKLAELLTDEGVEVKRAAADFICGDKPVPAGSYVVSLAQPSKRLIRVLLDPQVAMDDSFLKEQERRRKRRLPDEIYDDVTAWSLPLLYNVEMLTAREASKGSFEIVQAGAPRPGVVSGKAALAYLVPWGTSAAGRFLTAALRDNVQMWSSDKTFTQNGRKFPTGTLIVKIKENPATLHDTVARLAASSGAEVVATDSSWVDDGVNFGSRYVVRVRKANIAMAWDRPASPGSAGHTRFVLERQYGYPVSAVRTQQLASGDLSKYDVIILPDAGFGGSYSDILNTRHLRDWVSAGGTLIGIAGAVSYLADPKVALLAVQQENRPRAEPAKKPEPGETRPPGKLFAKEEEFEKAIQPDSEPPDPVTGVLAKARIDPEHWITAGMGDTVQAMVDARAIFTPIKVDKGVNAAIFLGPDQLLASGYMWEENRKQLAYKPLVVVQREGRGQIVGFTTDPNFRAFLDGMNTLFLNAVFRGHGRGGRGLGEQE